MGAQRHKLGLVLVKELLKKNLQCNEWKIESAEKQQKLVNSINKFGQLKPVVIYKDRIIAGSKILKALESCGEEKVLVLQLVDELSESDILLATLVVNELNFDTDYLDIAFKHSQKFENMRDVQSLLPFTKEDVEKMKIIKDFDWESFSKKGQAEGQATLFDLPEEIPIETLPIEEEAPIATVTDEGGNTEEMQPSEEDNKLAIEIAVHNRHCYQGQYRTSCKYGHENCPAKPIDVTPKVEEKVVEKVVEKPPLPPIIPHVVFLNPNGQYERRHEEEFNHLYNYKEVKPEIVFTGTYSECQLFVIEKNKSKSL